MIDPKRTKMSLNSNLVVNGLNWFFVASCNSCASVCKAVCGLLRNSVALYGHRNKYLVFCLFRIGIVIELWYCSKVFIIILLSLQREVVWLVRNFALLKVLSPRNESLFNFPYNDKTLQKARHSQYFQEIFMEENFFDWIRKMCRMYVLVQKVLKPTFPFKGKYFLLFWIELSKILKFYF